LVKRIDLIGGQMRLILLALIAALAAFAPPDRGLRYVFEAGSPGSQAGTVETMRKRVEAAGMNAVVEPLGADRIEVRAAGDIAQDKITRLLTRQGVMTFNLVDGAARAADYPLQEERDGRIALPNLSERGAPLVLYVDAILTSGDVASASPIIEESSRLPAVSIKLDPDGARNFGHATAQSVGRQIAVVVDDQIVLAPMVMTPITEGMIVISGSFSVEETQEMAAALQAPLPAAVKLIEVGTFGTAQ
jgi:preprotein translocase subunit SecD